MKLCGRSKVDLSNRKVKCFPICSRHGICEAGICVCEENWEGNDCGEKIIKETDLTKNCLNDCSGNGICIEGQCECDKEGAYSNLW